MNVSIQLDLAKYFVDNSSVGGKKSNLYSGFQVSSNITRYDSSNREISRLMANSEKITKIMGKPIMLLP